MRECDELVLTVLVDNYIDMLMSNSPGITRQGMPEHFGARRGTPLAENGISFLLRATTAGRTTTILFDAGMGPIPLVHNARLLGIDLTDVDQVVLSHGHPDHFGGIYAALEQIGYRVPVLVHPSAFAPRLIQRPDVTLQYFNKALTEHELTAAGAAVVPLKDPLEIAPGVMTSGEVPTTLDFEEEVPVGRMSVRDGHVCSDPIDDYMTLIVNVKGLGLIVLDPCGHAGVVSAVDHALKLGEGAPLHAVLGGFHLGHAGITQAKVDRTVDELLAREPAWVSPMHCSGFRTQRAVAERMPDAFTLMTVGTVVRFAA
ncbi:MBL fold metallo-hydrolase [Mycolicibacterium sp. BiH015]|uniref:MBL fold metallo-hydrolase n=1 Tax=Mycolicibacterium sp. BiH015 TaxID=3018808 RepID=UPI0022E40C51|nr:MBL fold metallo-hydrolase [Mycolicibacterium sp. BiH015]MDA2889434.1 MBL fold metallo-hydrolase [Mycolicibacterium sp. BiH015]